MKSFNKKHMHIYIDTMFMYIDRLCRQSYFPFLRSNFPAAKGALGASWKLLENEIAMENQHFFAGKSSLNGICQ